MTSTRPRSASQPDAELTRAVTNELRWTPGVDSSHIAVSVVDGAVTLCGEVGSYPERREAERAVQHVQGVRAIAEELTARSVFVADADVARAAGAAVERATDIPVGAVEVTVDDHVVTLTGSVPAHQQRESAARAVRYLRGVTDVRNLIRLRPTGPTKSIVNEIAAALVRNATLRGRRCTVSADSKGSVTLTGTVASWPERHEIDRIAWAAPGVTAVINQVRVRD